MLRELAKLGDSELWLEICKKAEKFGYTLPKETPPPEQMAKIRSVMNDADKINTAEILKLMTAFKAKRGRG